MALWKNPEFFIVKSAPMEKLERSFYQDVEKQIVGAIKIFTDIYYYSRDSGGA